MIALRDALRGCIMPIEMKYDSSLHVWEFVARGELSWEDLEQTMEALVSHPQHRPTHDTLWDLREIQMAEVQISELRSAVGVMERFRGRRGPAKVALVADRDVNFGVFRMYEVVADDLPQTFRVFRSIQDARSWLAEEAPGPR